MTDAELRKEWLKESVNTGSNIPDYVADWWLAKFAQERSELVEGIESLRSTADRTVHRNGTWTCNDCGLGDDDCECATYNQAITDVLSLIKEV